MSESATSVLEENCENIVQLPQSVYRSKFVKNGDSAKVAVIKLWRKTNNATSFITEHAWVGCCSFTYLWYQIEQVTRPIYSKPIRWPGKSSLGWTGYVLLHDDAERMSRTENMLYVRTCNILCERGDLTIDWLIMEIMYSVIQQ